MEYKAPTTLKFKEKRDRPSIGLFGSIEQGKASNWQAKAISWLTCYNLDIYNPRREFWDPNWEQTADCDHFKKQINWELDALINVDVALFYFEYDTKSPVTLVELGLSRSFNYLDTMVCCQEGYWRKGVIDIACQKFGIHQEDNLEDLVGYSISVLTRYHGLKLLANKSKIVIPPKVALTTPTDPIDDL